MAQKNIQINKDMFLDLLRYFLHEDDPEELRKLENKIKAGLTIKVDALIARQMYSEYVKSPAGDRRELLRKRYLEHIGVREEFRTSSEWHPEEPPEAP